VTKPVTKKAKRGRPTKYDKAYHPKKAFAFCREYGLKDTALADMFDISEATLNTWKHLHPEFLESLRAAKDEFDSDNAENSLYKRLCGFCFDEITQELVDGNMVETRRVTKQIPPDSTSLIFWLKNRRRNRWRDKTETEHSGAVTIMKPAAIAKPQRAGVSDE